MEKEIIECNKLIAEFMGFTPPKSGSNLLTPEKVLVAPDKKKSYISLNELKYHSSWDWLMPVIEKIENEKLGDIYLEINDTNYLNAVVELEIVGNVCHVNLYGDMRTYGRWIYGEAHSTKLEAAYHTVIEFIKWYNNEQNRRTETTA